MECSMKIDCDWSDETFETIFPQEMIKAEEEIKCDECHLVIPLGASYERWGGEIEKDSYYYYTCSSCLSVRNVFFDNWYFGGIWEELENEIDELNGEIPEACLRELTPEARGTVCEVIEEYWKDHSEYYEDEE